MSVTRNWLPWRKTRNGLPGKDPCAYDQAMRYLAIITMLVLAMTLAQPVAAQSFKPDRKAGWDAYHKKDYAMALRHWRPLAKQGHAKTQHNLGVMYHDGMGVVQDLVMARSISRPTIFGTLRLAMP